MKNGVTLRVVAEVTLSMSERELAVVGHLMGYDPAYILGSVTTQHTLDELKEVARSMRAKCESATALIATARRAIVDSDKVRSAAERIDQ